MGIGIGCKQLCKDLHGEQTMFQMHEMLQLLPKDPDSESGSYTDSGHGQSEEGEILQQAEKKMLGNNASKGP